ncbi:hypothetical protein FB451DRAFT_1178337 [Mycena latifolia]|nr:hypothetical protein FB451DRAFT_1178337 [Mycena latifolia]
MPAASSISQNPDASPIPYPHTSGPQTLHVSDDLIRIHNCGMNVWISRTDLTVGFGNVMSTSHVEGRSETRFTDLLRTLETSSFVVRTKDECCFSIQVVDTPPSLGGGEVRSPGQPRRFASVRQDSESICIHQPWLSLELDRNRGNLRFGDFPSEPLGQQLTIHQGENVGGGEYYTLFRSPLIAVDVRLDVHRIDIRWKLHKIHGTK